MEEQPRPKGKVVGSSPAEGTSPDLLEGIYLKAERLVEDILALQRAVIEGDGEAVYNAHLVIVEGTLNTLNYHARLIRSVAPSDIARRFTRTVNAAP